MKQRATPQAETHLKLAHTIRLSADKHAPLVYLVHGRAGDLTVMWTFARCIPEHFSIIAPQAPLSDSEGGFSWWRMDAASQRDAIEAAAAELQAFMRAAQEYYQLDPARKVCMGFSQGAALLSLVMQHEPLLFDGLAMLAGVVIRSKQVLSPKTLQGKPIFMAHGTDDKVVLVAKAREGESYLRSLGARVEFVEDPVAHKVGSQGMKDLKKWMQRFSEAV